MKTQEKNIVVPDGISNLSQLEQVDIGSYNYLGPQAISALTDALEKNRVSTQLNLMSNNIGPEGAKALADALKNQQRNKLYKAIDAAAVFCAGFSLAFAKESYNTSISGENKVLPDDVVMHIIELYLEQASLFEHDMPSNQSKVSPEFSLAENIFEKVKVILNNPSPIAKLGGKESNAAQQESTSLLDGQQSTHNQPQENKPNQSQPHIDSAASGKQAALMSQLGTFAPNTGNTKEQQPAAPQHQDTIQARKTKLENS